MGILHSTFLDTDKRLFFIFICLISGLLTYLAQTFFVTEELFYYSLGEQVAVERFEKLWAESHRQTYCYAQEGHFEIGFKPQAKLSKDDMGKISGGNYLFPTFSKFFSPSPILSDCYALCLLL
jgi:hypothetical protein